MADSTLTKQWLLECHEVGHFFSISSTHESFGCKPVNFFFSYRFWLVGEKPRLKPMEEMAFKITPRSGFRGYWANIKDYARCHRREVTGFETVLATLHISLYDNNFHCFVTITSGIIKTEPKPLQCSTTGSNLHQELHQPVPDFDRDIIFDLTSRAREAKTKVWQEHWHYYWHYYWQFISVTSFCSSNIIYSSQPNQPCQVLIWYAGMYGFLPITIRHDRCWKMWTWQR